VVAKDEEIDRIVSTLHDKWGVEYIAPGHCTGEPAFAALKRVFGERYLYAGLGTTISLGASPRSLDQSAAGMPVDEDDPGSYPLLSRREEDGAAGDIA